MTPAFNAAVGDVLDTVTNHRIVTVDGIVDDTGRSRSAVDTALAHLVRDHRVVRRTGADQRSLYTLPGTAIPRQHLTIAEQVRDMLSATEPRTATHITDAVRWPTPVYVTNVTIVLRKLERAGLAKRAGTVRVPPHNTSAPLWVRA